MFLVEINNSLSSLISEEIEVIFIFHITSLPSELEERSFKNLKNEVE